jgi:ADP-ribose pyrophosphatase YjhB (NUDIX family)
MHKTFYASGFLFHLPTQQILLQQLPDSSWSLFGGEKEDSSDPEEAFQEIIHEHLRIKLPTDTIHLIYDYIHPSLNRKHVIFYAEIEEAQDTFKLKKDQAVGWFTFKQLYKLPLTAQTKHDITVGQRVVDALARKLNPPPEVIV